MKESLEGEMRLWNSVTSSIFNKLDILKEGLLFGKSWLKGRRVG